MGKMWITDRLPEKSGSYLVTTKKGCVYIAKFYRDLFGEQYWGGKFENCVAAWQNLPERYIKGDVAEEKNDFE